MKEWAEGVTDELQKLIRLAEDYRNAASHDASGWMAGTQRAADSHDRLMVEFTQACIRRPAIVCEGLLRLKDALRDAYV